MLLWLIRSACFAGVQGRLKSFPQESSLLSVETALTDAKRTIPMNENNRLACLAGHVDGKAECMERLLDIRIDSRMDYTLLHCAECGNYWLRVFYEHPASGGGMVSVHFFL